MHSSSSSNNNRSKNDSSNYTAAFSPKNEECGPSVQTKKETIVNNVYVRPLDLFFIVLPVAGKI